MAQVHRPTISYEARRSRAPTARIDASNDDHDTGGMVPPATRTQHSQVQDFDYVNYESQRHLPPYRYRRNASPQPRMHTLNRSGSPMPNGFLCAPLARPVAEFGDEHPLPGGDLSLARPLHSMPSSSRFGPGNPDSTGVSDRPYSELVEHPRRWDEGLHISRHGTQRPSCRVRSASLTAEDIKTRRATPPVGGGRSESHHNTSPCLLQEPFFQLPDGPIPGGHTTSSSIPRSPFSSFSNEHLTRRHHSSATVDPQHTPPGEQAAHDHRIRSHQLPSLFWRKLHSLTALSWMNFIFPMLYTLALAFALLLGILEDSTTFASPFPTWFTSAVLYSFSTSLTLILSALFTILQLHLQDRRSWSRCDSARRAEEGLEVDETRRSGTQGHFTTAVCCTAVVCITGLVGVFVAIKSPNWSNFLLGSGGAGLSYVIYVAMIVAREGEGVEE